MYDKVGVRTDSYQVCVYVRQGRCPDRQLSEGLCLRMPWWMVSWLVGKRSANTHSHLDTATKKKT